MVCEAEEYGCLLNTKGGENIEIFKFHPLTIRPQLDCGGGRGEPREQCGPWSRS